MIGAGPAGLEAARVLGARGHQVVVLEANDKPGGQVLLAAKATHRRDLLGIVDWRVDELRRHDVDLRVGVFAERDDVLAENPDLVIVATGGLPHRGFGGSGEDLIKDCWDVLAGDVKLAGDVLVIDDSGGHAGLDAAEYAAGHGTRVEIVTRERMVGMDVGAMNIDPYLQAFARHDVRVTTSLILRAVNRDEGRLRVTLWSEYAELEFERTVDHVVLEAGTDPVDDLYFALKPDSANLGQVDHRALIAMAPQSLAPNPSGAFQLFRIGDAVTSRNLHAAIYDAQRLCQPV